MNGRVSPRSSRPPLSFILTSREPFPAPNSTSAIVSAGRLQARPSSGKVAQNVSAAATQTRRLPKRRTAGATIGITATAPAATPSNARPSCPSVRPRREVTSGIRDTQLPNVVPLIKNKIVTAVRGHVPKSAALAVCSLLILNYLLGHPRQTKLKRSSVDVRARQ